jgi:hypothetical protein
MLSSFLAVLLLSSIGAGVAAAEPVRSSKCASAELRSKVASGDLTLNVASGDLTLNVASGDLTLNVASGDLTPHQPLKSTS